MDFQPAMAVTKIVNEIYEGGIENFHKDGAAIGYTSDFTKAYIYHPKASEHLSTLKKVIEETAEIQLELTVTEQSNTGDYPDCDFRELLKECLASNSIIKEEFLAGVDYNHAFFSVSVNLPYAESTAKEYALYLLEKLPLLRGEVILSGTPYFFERELLGKHQYATVKVPSLNENLMKRTSPISDDEILDLRIILNQNTDVLDIIEQL